MLGLRGADTAIRQRTKVKIKRLDTEYMTTNVEESVICNAHGQKQKQVTSDIARLSLYVSDRHDSVDSALNLYVYIGMQRLARLKLS
jgi:hypothetical protein